MKRIRVPEEGLIVAQEAAVNLTDDDCCGEPTRAQIATTAVESFLLWLSEHPQVPTDEQWNELLKEFPPCDFLKTYGFAQIFEAWQRRCFVQEEPEIAEIDATIPDLLFDAPTNVVINEANRHIREAYRRGLRKGEQK